VIPAYRERSGLLQGDALSEYRRLIDAEYDAAARQARSAFTWLEAFEGLATNISTVSWKAFPLTANAPFLEIDRDRRLQDEYVEWRAEHGGDGRLERVTFTTMFPEVYEAAAIASFEELVRVIQGVIPGADPSVRDLFGVDEDPSSLEPRMRGRLFNRQRESNPWNDGARGILCLFQRSNTLGALFKLLADCGEPRIDLAPSAVCGNSNCVPERASDPFVCVAAQAAARSGKAITLADPAGIRIDQLSGIWALEGREIPINVPGENEGIWRISHGGLRGVLEVRPGLTMDGSALTSGARVATNLSVAADVLSASDADLPTWARTGHEALGRQS